MTFWTYMWIAFYFAGVYMVLVDDAPRARRDRGEGSVFAQRLDQLFHGTWGRSFLTALLWPLAILLGITLLIGYNTRQRSRG